jgi:hypothetical protein
MRPTRFQKMGSAFSRAFGNADAIFTIDGVQGLPVRIILRNGVSLDVADEQGQDIEAKTYSLSVAAADVIGLASLRDSMTFEGNTYSIRNHDDDGHAMLRIFVTGDIR